MAIALRGTPTTGSANNGGNIALTLPSGLAQNDVVYVGFALSSAAGGGTSSSGWTQLGATLDNTIRLQMFRKVMGATPDTSITLTGSGTGTESSSAIAIAFSGVDTALPEDGVARTTATGNSTNPNCPSITPATTGDICIAYAATRLIDTTGTGAPTGYSNFTQQSSNDNNDTTSYLSWKSGLTASTPEDPSAYTGVSTALWGAFSVVVKPDLNVTGTAAQTATKAAQALSGTETFTGTAAQTVTKAAQSASGTVGEPITGTAVQTITKAQQAVSGTVANPITGTAAQTITKAQQAASGAETFSGPAVQVITKAQQDAAGMVTGGPVAGNDSSAVFRIRKNGPGNYTLYRVF